VLDSGTQVASSILSYATKGWTYDQKPSWDEWGMMTRMLTDILQVVQAARQCNFIVVTHTLILEEKDVDKKLVETQTAENLYSGIYPLMGTKPFSIGVPKYFGHIIYANMSMRKHMAGSSTGYKQDVISGSRSGMRIEDAKAGPDLSSVFDRLSLAGITTVETGETKK
jgi:hypothetical protein